MHSRTLASIAGAALVALLYVCTLSEGWLGHVGSDDVAYVGAARAWLAEDDYLPPSHWAVRHTLTLPTSLAQSSLGDNELASIVPALAYSAGLLLVVGWVAWRWFGRVVAALTLIVLVVTPAYSEVSTLAGVDIVEGFFVFAAFACYLLARERAGPTHLLLLVGLLSGLAFLSRETSVAWLVFLGLMFLFNPGFHRWRYWVMALPFLGLLLAEGTVYAMNGGSVLHRFEIVLGMVGAEAPPEATGNITEIWYVAPIAALLFNNEPAVLFWLLAPAVYFSWRWRVGGHGGHGAGDEPARSRDPGMALVQILVLALVWFVVIGYVLGLRALPRYFLLDMLLGAVVLAIWIDGLLARSRRLIACAVLAVHVGFGLLMIDLTNQQYMHAERVLVRLLEGDRELKLATNPNTAHRARQLLEWHGIEPERVDVEPPRPGATYLYSPVGSARGYAGRVTFSPNDYVPARSWQVIARYDSNPTRVGALMMALGLEDLLRSAGLTRVIWESEHAVLYAVGTDDGGRSSK